MDRTLSKINYCMKFTVYSFQFFWRTQVIGRWRVMRTGGGENTTTWKINSWSISGFSGVFGGILSKLDLRENGRLLDGHRPKAGGWRLEDRMIYHEEREGHGGEDEG